jgi:sigma-B regulation protein RsbU (phosphoserine phosphatase)
MSLILLIEDDPAIRRGLSDNLIGEAYDDAALCHPARGVGGDYYDFIDLGAGVLGLVVADVSGKGITAALTMAALHTLIRNEAPRFGVRCDELVINVNRVLYEAIDAARYATLFYGVYVDAARSFTYVNAGHPAPLLIRRHDTWDPALSIDLDSSAPPVGMFPTLAAVRGSVELRPGDWLILFSDGVTEALNNGQEEFGCRRLAEVVRAHRSLSAEAMCDAVRQEAGRHAAGEPQSDDLTLVVARVTA